MESKFKIGDKVVFYKNDNSFDYLENFPSAQGLYGKISTVHSVDKCSCTLEEDRGSWNYDFDDLKLVCVENESEDDSDSFQKFDTSKNRLDLIEPEFIEGIGRILTFGAEKYEAHNWKKAEGDDIDRIKGAALRHLMSYLKGDKLDSETDQSHLYHIACCIMFLDYFDRKEDLDADDQG